ncbi:MAG: M56 family metallopeptidase [Clostridia bacterium]|nr:M56 family metallopeptidase [Clostridia bacterium]
MMNLIGGVLFVSIISTMFIGMVLLLRKLLKKTYIYWRMILWTIIIVRLLLPITFSWQFSVFNLIGEDSQIIISIDDIKNKAHLSIQGELYYNDETEKDIDSESFLHEDAQVGVIVLTLNTVLFIIWVGGVIVSAVVYYVGYKRHRRNLNIALCDNNRILTILSEECKKLKIRCEAYWNFNDDLILLSGVLKPRILISSALLGCTDDQIRFAIRHELAHYMHHDLFLLHIYSLVRILHWFNPMIWMMEGILREDMEISADAAAIIRSPIYDRKAYGNTLIVMSSMFAQKEMHYAAQLLNRKSLKSRVSSIVNFKRKSIPKNLFISILSFLLVFACTTLPVTVSGTHTDPIEFAESLVDNLDEYDMLHKHVVGAMLYNGIVELDPYELLDHSRYSVVYDDKPGGISYCLRPDDRETGVLNESGLFWCRLRFNACTPNELLQERMTNGDDVLTNPIKITNEVIDISSIKGDINRMYMRYVIYEDAMHHTSNDGEIYRADLIACEYLMTTKSCDTISIAFVKAIVDTTDFYEGAPWRDLAFADDEQNRITYVFSEKQMLELLLTIDFSVFDFKMHSGSLGGGGLCKLIVFSLD